MKKMIVVVNPCKIKDVAAVAEKYGWTVIEIGCDANLAKDISTTTRVLIQMNDELNATSIIKDLDEKDEDNKGKLLIILSCGIMDISENPTDWAEFSLNHHYQVVCRYNAIIYPASDIWEKYNHPNIIKDEPSLVKLLDR